VRRGYFAVVFAFSAIAVPVVTANESSSSSMTMPRPAGTAVDDGLAVICRDAIAAASASPDRVVVKVRPGEYVFGAPLLIERSLDLLQRKHRLEALLKELDAP
jgi:hypothetical protein